MKKSIQRDSCKRRIRALERDLLKKKNKELRNKIKELEDESTAIN